jgi:hypothetical protein
MLRRRRRPAFAKRRLFKTSAIYLLLRLAFAFFLRLSGGSPAQYPAAMLRRRRRPRLAARCSAIIETLPSSLNFTA